MSYRRMRVYRCDICGKREVGSKPIGFWHLPLGWHGSYKRNGRCLCGRCFKAFGSLSMYM